MKTHVIIINGKDRGRLGTINGDIVERISALGMRGKVAVSFYNPDGFSIRMLRQMREATMLEITWDRDAAWRVKRRMT